MIISFLIYSKLLFYRMKNLGPTTCINIRIMSSSEYGYKGIFQYQILNSEILSLDIKEN